MSAYFAVAGFGCGLDRDNGAERDRPTEGAAHGDSTVQCGDPRIAVETRTRGEAYADLRQIVESGWDRHQGFDIPRGELAMFRAERAGLRRSAPGGRQAITHPHRLPSDELFDGSEEAFPRRL